jgi:hypothetical protein
MNMNVKINESVREAGLEEGVRNASALLPKVIARALQHRVEATWDVLSDKSDSRWALLELKFDGEVAERDVFKPASLADHEFMRDRIGLLWDKVLRTSMRQRLDTPGGRVEVVEPVIHMNNG